MGEGAKEAAAGLAQYVGGKAQVPCPTYFIESRSAAMLQAAPEGKTLCENLHFLGGFGVKEIEGLNLFDALDRVVKPPKRDSKKPLRMPVSGVHKIKGVGDVITGRIEQGALHPNEPVGFAPTGVTGKCFTIEMHHKNVQEANTGDNVGVNVKGLPKEANKLPKVGDVMYVTTEDPATPPPTASTKGSRPHASAARYASCS